MIKLAKTALLALGMGIVGGSAFAQAPITINAGPGSFKLSNYSGHRADNLAGIADFSLGGFDHLNQCGLWYRTSTDTREYALSNLTLTQTSSTSFDLQYSEPINGVANGLKYDVVYLLNQTGAAEDTLDIRWKVTNTSNATTTVHTFCYGDLDLKGTAGGDTADFVGNEMVSWDGSYYAKMSEFDYAGTNLSFANFELSAYDVSNGLRAKLADASKITLANGATVFGPGDQNGAYDVPYILAPGVSGGGTFRLRIRHDNAISGKVNLQEFGGDYSDRTLKFEVYNRVSPFQLIQTKTVTPDANGNFYFSTIASGVSFDVYCKSPISLRRKLIVPFGSDGASNIGFNLINGDCDDDNVVSILDYSLLSNAFDTTIGQAKYDARADLDGDGSVSILDYSVLSNSFDIEGD